MITFDFSNTIIDDLITHHIGNKTRDEDLILSDDNSVFDEQTSQYLLNYFLSTIKPEDFYNFSHPVNLEMNEIYSLATKIFNNKDLFIRESHNIAKLLYNHSTHPNIKEGELNIVIFNEIVYEDVVLNAIGIYKSENTVPFLRMQKKDKSFLIDHEFGFELQKIDKACIIFNIDPEKGYSILVKDNTNKQADALYWIDDFLQLKASNDAYHNTKDVLKITKKFVTQQMSEEYDVSNTEKIDILNKTLDYFKNNDSFDKDEFEKNIFKDKEVIQSYQMFNASFKEDNEIQLNNSFEISDQAVKKQSRNYKSVLKLDKNFHVYIHGDKSLIERGVENDGRKYYKIYYENEK